MGTMGRLGERPIAVTGVGVVVGMLPSKGGRCVMLNVPASGISETVGVARSSAVPAKVLSPSSIAISWKPTAGGISLVPDISASWDSSDCTLSVAFKSSVSVVEF